MKSFYETLKNHIESYPLNYGDSDIQSILEILWNTYCQHNQLDTEQIKAGFANLYRHMKHLPLSDVDGVIDIVCSLCWEHEKAGFVEGVKVGIRLGQELTN